MLQLCSTAIANNNKDTKKARFPAPFDLDFAQNQAADFGLIRLRSSSNSAI